MTDYELKKLQEKRLSMLSNGFYYLALILGTIVIISKIIILFALWKKKLIGMPCQW